MSTIKQIDQALGRYYKKLGVDHYFNTDGIGIFQAWCDRIGYDENVLNQEFNKNPSDCTIIGFDENFPLQNETNNESERAKQIINIIHKCYNDPNAFSNDKNHIENTKTIIRKNRKDIVFGYLRKCQYLLPIIQLIILLFYGEHKQVIILQDNDLRTRSIQLTTGDNNEFIKFLKIILKSKLNNTIWNKCDPHNTGKIKTNNFMYFLNLPVTLFKVAKFKRIHSNKPPPKLDKTELEKEFLHLAIWIIRKYGITHSDGGATIVLKKQNYVENIIEYIKCYGEAKGELYEQFDYISINTDIIGSNISNISNVVITAENNNNNKHVQKKRIRGQISILQDNDLRMRSVELVTDEFIQFLKLVLKGELKERIWNKCDFDNSGKIETEKLMYFLSCLFRRLQRTYDDEFIQKNRLSYLLGCVDGFTDLVESPQKLGMFTHLAIWIIRRYGEKQSNGDAILVLTKEHFAENIVEYVKQYADVKGE